MSGWVSLTFLCFEECGRGSHGDGRADPNQGNGNILIRSLTIEMRARAVIRKYLGGVKGRYGISGLFSFRSLFFHHAVYKCIASSRIGN